jgi:hypothetical protein
MQKHCKANYAETYISNTQEIINTSKFIQSGENYTFLASKKTGVVKIAYFQGVVAF